MPLIGAKPKLGDLIEFSHVGYDHWGVYVGDDYVIHLTAADGLSSIASDLGRPGLFSGVGNKAVVKKQLLKEVARGCNYKVNNKYDNKRKPRPQKQIVKEAEKEYKKNKKYNLFKANCEHFATEIRYGRSFCEQVINVNASVLGGAATMIGTGLFTLATGATGGAALGLAAVAGAATCVISFLGSRLIN